jgi:murein DD-endopeptidase MepM/ murein hydrolase activator NlpD
MERLSLIVVSDETSPIRRFDVRRTTVKRALWGAGAAAALLLVALADWVYVRIEHVELERLRVETSEQQARIDSFDEAVADVEATLQQVKEFERKVRVIANLPGSAAAGGNDVVEVGGAEGGDLATQGEGLEAVPTGGLPPAGGPTAADGAAGKARAANLEDQVSLLRQEAMRLHHVAQQRQLSLEELVAELQDKHERMGSSPAVWPTEGWLTSRFGTRISPFTGKRQFHSGIDVAGARGTAVIATASGKVVFAGSKGPLGKTLILDHDHGIRTHYGHNDEILVERGDRVERGDAIARMGNSGRSTGPHLHYTVEVHGKAVNPLDYIFD